MVTRKTGINMGRKVYSEGKYYEGGLKNYKSYLKKEIKRHLLNAKNYGGLASICGMNIVVGLQSAIDELYENFPEMKPKQYKTITEQILEKNQSKKLKDRLKVLKK